MELFDSKDRGFAEGLYRLINCNPFLSEWVEQERATLGPAFTEVSRAYVRPAQWAADYLHPNVVALGERVDHLAEQTRQRLADGARPTDEELRLYEDLVMYYLYRQKALQRDLDRVAQSLVPAESQDSKGITRRQEIDAKVWDQFKKDFEKFFALTGGKAPSGREPTHVFAWFFQLRRAFFHIYNHLVGSSESMIRLRGAVWQSIFTHDMRRWSRALYERMGQIPTLITGPSGTGKELVARAIGLSRYIPFEEGAKCFKADFAGSSHPLNLSALAPTLIESELFGHVKGAFTGAVKDRDGWLELCGEYGTVFLDEIGELDAAIQVKLLRVLQSGRFQRLGDHKDRQFKGKIIAATNRDLAAEMRAGRFRGDFYYRLCADQIETPSLRQQLDQAPADLHDLLLFIAQKVVGGREAESLACEAKDWIDHKLLRDYPWPGNFRELEQCVRNIMIRGTYRPASRNGQTDDPRQDLATAVVGGSLTVAELERRYFTLVYAQTGDFKEAARRLQCDWRTLKSKIDPDLLRQLKHHGNSTSAGASTN